MLSVKWGRGENMKALGLVGGIGVRRKGAERKGSKSEAQLWALHSFAEGFPTCLYMVCSQTVSL